MQDLIVNCKEGLSSLNQMQLLCAFLHSNHRESSQQICTSNDSTMSPSIYIVSTCAVFDRKIQGGLREAAVLQVRKVGVSEAAVRVNCALSR